MNRNLMTAIKKYHAMCAANDPGIRLSETLRLSLLDAVSKSMSNHDIQRINSFIGTPITTTEQIDEGRLSAVRNYLEVCAADEPSVQTEVIAVTDAVAENNTRLIEQWEQKVNGAMLEIVEGGKITDDLDEAGIDEVLKPVQEAVDTATSTVFQTQ